MVSLIIAGTLMLVGVQRSSALVASPPQEVTSISALPHAAALVMNDTVTVTVAVPGHTYNVLATPLTNHTAVTPYMIAPDAMLSGSIPGHRPFPMQYLRTSSETGFSVLHYTTSVVAAHLAPLPLQSDSVAVSIKTTATFRVTGYLWANTVLGDPILDRSGTRAWYATEADSDINTFTNGVALNASGDVVALLAPTHLWYSAQDLARSAGGH